MVESVFDRARRRIDTAFGIGVAEAHEILRTDVAAKRIYDCTVLALANAEAEILALKAGVGLDAAKLSRS